MAKRTSRRRNKQTSENLVTQEAVKMGLMGGKYKPLTGHDIEQIHQTALDVLENIGMGDPIPEFKEAWICEKSILLKSTLLFLNIPEKS